MVEVYNAIHSNRKYLVSTNPNLLWKEALKRWKIAESLIEVTGCWILNDELYLKDPKNKKAVYMWTAYTCSERKSA